MHRYVARANVDHYLGMLSGERLSSQDRHTVTKLLIAEEDKLSHDLEHLGFAEDRVAKGRERLTQVRALRDGLAFGSAERSHADRLLVNIENIQTLLEDFCHRLRDRISAREL